MVSATRAPWKRATLTVVLTIAGMGAFAASARADDGRIVFEITSPTVEPGSKATTALRLAGPDGSPRPASRPVTISIHGGAGLVSRERIEIPAGSSAARLTLKPERPGTWTLHATADGWQPAEARIVSPAKQSAALSEAIARVDAITEAQARLPRAREGSPQERVGVIAPEPTGPSPQIEARARLPRTEAAGPGSATERQVQPEPRLESPAPPLAQSASVALEVPASLSQQDVDAVVASLADAGFERSQQTTKAFEPGMIGFRRKLLEAIRDPRIAGAERPAIQLSAEGSSASPATNVHLVGIPGLEGTLQVTSGPAGSADPPEILEHGEVRLVAIPTRPVSPYEGRWDPVQIIAEWYPGKAEETPPAPRLTDLQVTLRMDYGRRPRLEPEKLTIPAGRVVAEARLESDHAQTVHVKPVWATRRDADPLAIEFLPPGAHRLVFDHLPETVRGLGPIRRTVRIRVVDDTDRSVEVSEPLSVNLRWQSEGDDDETETVVLSGASGSSAEIELADVGRYLLIAEAPGLDSADATVFYRLAWGLLVAAALGGLGGALAAALFRRDRHWVRAALLGLLSGLIASLLFRWGLLDKLTPGIPIASDLQARVPVSNILGILTIALVAGLAFESVIGALVRRRRTSEGSPSGA